ncbi:transglutaminase-like domain-containing protein [Caulobacter sp. DWP3-1-3b2]|uniref:transglutaminase-like domain-containing protein n=1 Tax=Caulobacter sp. DWP3-1-3b2 TaxID=2804643 RepID=UPI003CEAA421
MRVKVEARLDYEFPERSESLLQIEAAVAADQRVIGETLTFDPPLVVTRRDDPTTGERRVAFTHQGHLSMVYTAEVEIDPREMELTGSDQHPIAELPVDTLPFLRGSRYCPSDTFETIARQKFGSLRGGERVSAIMDWIAAHLEYIPCSDSRTTALETYVQRAGVCRDYAHLAVTLCRASDIPARVASVYALGLHPPDFHAVAEVFVGDRWRLLDPTGLAPIDGLVRIAYGRDAADVAFLTIFGRANMVAQSVTVTLA